MTGTNLSLLSYAYDNDDNITSVTDGVSASASTSFAYDNLGRLTRASTAQASTTPGNYQRQDYAYDANGNRTAVEWRMAAGDVSAAKADAYTRTAGTNRLASIATTGAASGSRSFTQDARGNQSLESRNISGSLTSIAASYDGHGRLISYATGASPALNFAYNGLGDRVMQGESGGGASAIRRYIYDSQGRMIGEYGTGASDAKGEYIYLHPDAANDNDSPHASDDGQGGNGLLAVMAPDASAGNAVTAQYVHTNHLGAPLFMTNESGAVTTPGTYAQPVFPGQIRTRADLYHNRYRDYDPTTGRYIQADPIGLAGGNNPYLYANGNPMRYVDPDGLWVDTVADVGFVFYDLYRIGRDNIFGNNCPGSLKENLTALGLDAGAIFIPFATGIGPASRVGRHIDDVPTPYDNLLKNARDKYPKKAEKYENHHITPKYLGGAKNGPTSNIDAAYHQEITNAFRKEWRYGGGKPNPEQLRDIMNKVYSQFPLIVF